jgi:hypothetical protein
LAIPVQRVREGEGGVSESLSQSRSEMGRMEERARMQSAGEGEGAGEKEAGRKRWEEIKRILRPCGQGVGLAIL